ncbi:MAG: outer membrane beta-barrel protein, partial [Alistipes sp.]
MKKYILIICICLFGISGAYAQSYVTFWTNEASCGPLDVYFNDSYVGQITKRYSSTPDCHATGCVTVRARYKYNSYVVRAEDGSEWTEDNLYVDGSKECTRIRLWGHTAQNSSSSDGDSSSSGDSNAGTIAQAAIGTAAVVGLAAIVSSAFSDGDWDIDREKEWSVGPRLTGQISMLCFDDDQTFFRPSAAIGVFGEYFPNPNRIFFFGGYVGYSFQGGTINEQDDNAPKYKLNYLNVDAYVGIKNRGYLKVGFRTGFLMSAKRVIDDNKTDLTDSFNKVTFGPVIEGGYSFPKFDIGMEIACPVTNLAKKEATSYKSFMLSVG